MDNIKKWVNRETQPPHKVSIFDESIINQETTPPRKVSMSIKEARLHKINKVKNAIIEDGKILRQKGVLMTDIYEFWNNGTITYKSNKDKHQYDVGYYLNKNESFYLCQDIRDAYRKLFDEYYDDVDFVCYESAARECTVLKMVKK